MIGGHPGAAIADFADERAVLYAGGEADKAAGRAQSRIGDASLWEIRVGLNYRF